MSKINVSHEFIFEQKFDVGWVDIGFIPLTNYNPRQRHLQLYKILHSNKPSQSSSSWHYDRYESTLIYIRIFYERIEFYSLEIIIN